MDDRHVAGLGHGGLDRLRSSTCSEVETATDKLGADSGYMDWLTSIDSHFIGPIIDGALQVVSGAPSGDAPGYAQGGDRRMRQRLRCPRRWPRVSRSAAAGDADHRERGAVLHAR